MMHRWWAVPVLAWVAWAHSTFPSKGFDQWTPAGATETLDACKQAALAAANNSIRKLRAQDDGSTTFAHSGNVIEVTFSTGEKASHVFLCLPDTVDPRGPKGK